jgi:hypothetical protein
MAKTPDARLRGQLNLMLPIRGSKGMQANTIDAKKLARDRLMQDLTNAGLRKSE